MLDLDSIGRQTSRSEYYLLVLFLSTHWLSLSNLPIFLLLRAWTTLSNVEVLTQKGKLDSSWFRSCLLVRRCIPLASFIEIWSWETSFWTRIWMSRLETSVWLLCWRIRRRGRSEFRDFESSRNWSSFEGVWDADLLDCLFFPICFPGPSVVLQTTLLQRFSTTLELDIVSK